MEVLGIDIGGSGIKGALVDVEKGVLTQERFRIPTPEPSTPDAVGCWQRCRPCLTVWSTSPARPRRLGSRCPLRHRLENRRKPRYRPDRRR